MAKNWEHAAGVLWNILVAAARAGKTTTYKAVSGPLDTNPLSVRNALEPIQAYCMANRLPPLTAIVVNSSTGLPGPGFIAWDVDDIAQANALVFGFSWDAVDNPYGGFGLLDTTESLAKKLIEVPGSEAEVYAKARVRGVVQQFFRRALMHAYDGKCAMCGFSFGEALDAAHLVPWGEASHSERMSVNNGLLLCANHHRLFDVGYLKLNQDLRIIHDDEDCSDETYGTSDRQQTSDIAGCKIRLPAIPTLHPGAIFIERRYKKEAT